MKNQVKKEQKIKDHQEFLKEVSILMDKYNILIRARESLHCIWSKNQSLKDETMLGLSDFNPDHKK